MNKVYSLLTVLALSVLSASAGVIVLEGNYQGKNIYVQNPFASSGVGFCVYEVTINDQTTTDEINSSAFEIDFSFFQLALGSKVEVKIKYKDDCKPKVLNAEVLKPMATFDIDALAVSKEGVLIFNTKNETGSLPYTVEQFRWNKWVDVGTVQGKGSPDINKYEFQIGTIHSGENKFRVKQVDASGKPRYSIETKYKSPLPPVTFNDAGKKVSTSVSFSDKTMYEIFNAYGNIVQKGIDKSVDVSKLDKGSYQVNFDNTFGEFKK